MMFLLSIPIIIMSLLYIGILLSSFLYESHLRDDIIDRRFSYFCIDGITQLVYALATWGLGIQYWFKIPSTETFDFMNASIAVGWIWLVLFLVLTVSDKLFKSEE